MDKEQIKKLTESPEFIPGIYNYCDRWCERCPFTSRCMNFALHKEELGDPQELDPESQEFLGKLHELFDITVEMLQEMAAEQGIDIDALETDDPPPSKRRHHDTAKNNPCARAAKEYSQVAEDWLSSFEKTFPGFSPHDDAQEIFDVIRWYKHQIYIKIRRALHGIQETSWSAETEFYRDSDGSAKVALLGIDRSLAAWTELKHQLPEHRKRLAKICLHLEKLRQSIENAFPDARDFIRPGFDEIHQYPVIGNA